MKHLKPALIIPFALLLLSAPLPARERRGADVLIRKIDGTEVRGELIAVKSQALLVLSKEGRDVTVGVGEINSVKVSTKSKAISGAGLGFGLGLITAIVYGLSNPGTAEPVGTNVLGYSIVFGPGGALAGAIVGGLGGIDKTYQIQGWPSNIVKGRLNQLRKRARVRAFE